MKQTLSRCVCATFVVSLVAGLAGCSSTVQPLTKPEKPRIEGVELYNRGDYAAAAGAFKNAIRQEPRDYKAHYYLGLSYEALGSYQQAIQAYKASISCMKATLQGQEAIELRQRVMNRLAASIARSDDQNLEKDLLRQQVADPKLTATQHAEAYFLLAKIYRYRGDADSALDAYYKGAELDPKDFWLQKEAGSYMLQSGQKQRANVCLTRAAKISTHDAQLNQTIADAGGLVKVSEDAVMPAPDLAPSENTKTPPTQITEPILDK